MTTSSRIRFTAVALVCLLGFAQTSMGQHGKYTLSFYGGLTTERDLKSLTTLDYNGFVNSKIGVLALGRELKTYQEIPLRWEVEGQIAKHWGYQQHWETNVVLVLRWLDFPWDHKIDTSFAIGDGLSYASSKPKMELDKMGNTSNLLNYLMFEWECLVPKHKEWSIYFRIHHRSGIYGLINNVSGGSNMVTGGIRFRF